MFVCSPERMFYIYIRIYTYEDMYIWADNTPSGGSSRQELTRARMLRMCDLPCSNSVKSVLPFSPSLYRSENWVSGSKLP